MTAEQDSLDPTKVLARHPRVPWLPSQDACDGHDEYVPWPCETAAVAALALDLQGKVDRVERVHARVAEYAGDAIPEPDEIWAEYDAVLTDPLGREQAR